MTTPRDHPAWHKVRAMIGQWVNATSGDHLNLATDAAVAEMMKESNEETVEVRTYGGVINITVVKGNRQEFIELKKDKLKGLIADLIHLL